MEKSVTQRVMEFLESIHLTVNGLSRVINIGQPTLSKQMKEGGCGVSLTTVVLLLESYPDLSAEWLLRGEGDMKKGEEWKVTQFIPIQNNELVDALKDHITTLKADNERMRREIEEYRREKSAAPIEYSSVAAEGK